MSVVQSISITVVDPSGLHVGAFLASKCVVCVGSVGHVINVVDPSILLILYTIHHRTTSTAKIEGGTDSQADAHIDHISAPPIRANAIDTYEEVPGGSNSTEQSPQLLRRELVHLKVSDMHHLAAID